MGAVEIPPDLIGQSGLYNDPDPLLRRLRIEDTTGVSIPDIARYFHAKDLVVLYAGSEQGANNLRELHRDLTTFALKYLKSAAVIYVSADTDPKAAARILANQPWLRLTFHDNSDFAPLVPIREGARITELEEVARGEDFVQAGEIEVGAEKVDFGAEENENDYVRPLSRAAVTALMNVFSTPAISVYHIPSHRFVARNVRPSAFNSKNLETSHRLWSQGGSPALKASDIWLAMKWPLIGLFLAALYQLLVYFGGPKYAFIPKAMDAINWRAQPGAGKVL